MSTSTEKFIRKHDSRCPSVVNDEGSRSQKAIAFIPNSSLRNACVNTKTYSTVRIVPQELTNFSDRENPLNAFLNKKIGDKEWKK
jgi:hypothetical protein